MGWNDVATNNENKNENKIQYTKFETGNTVIRILDNEPESFWQHFLMKQNSAITCPGKDCPICNVIKAQKIAGEKPQYNSTKRHAMRIWNYNTNKMEILIQGNRFFSDLLNLHNNVGDLKSYDIKVIRSGSGTDTKYMLLPNQPSEFSITEGIEDVNLKELFAPPAREEILQLMEGKTWAEINEGKESVA